MKYAIFGLMFLGSAFSNAMENNFDDNIGNGMNNNDVIEESDVDECDSNSPISLGTWYALFGPLENNEELGNVNDIVNTDSERDELVTAGPGMNNANSGSNMNVSSSSDSQFHINNFHESLASEGDRYQLFQQTALDLLRRELGDSTDQTGAETSEPSHPVPNIFDLLVPLVPEVDPQQVLQQRDSSV